MLRAKALRSIKTMKLRLLFPLFLAARIIAADEFPPQPPIPALSPADELKTIRLPDGYRLELVLSEPDIKEPCLAVFDGNGRMYVAEMRTYMQDIDGKHQLEPVSRVSRHESTKGDGVFDMLPKPQKTKFIRITQTGEKKGTSWSIHELELLLPAQSKL